MTFQEGDRLRSRRLPIALAVALLASTVGQASAHAQAAREQRSTDYWVSNGSVTVGALLVAGGASLFDGEPMVDRFVVLADPGVKNHYSPTAARLSDAMVLVEMAAPVVVLGVATPRPIFWNASLVHAEALSLNLALNGLMKYAVRRPRPYTYHPDARVRSRYDCAKSADACLSFYSGHSSTAFTSAWSGLLLVNETVEMSKGYRALGWAAMMAGASATAHLRVRAGKHFYSDVVVGALVGTALGIGIPWLHGSRYSPSAGELGAGGAGLVLGGVLPLLLPADELPEDISLSVGGPGAFGLSLSGGF